MGRYLHMARLGLEHDGMSSLGLPRPYMTSVSFLVGTYMIAMNNVQSKKDDE